VTAFEDRLAAVDTRLTRFRENAKVPGVAWGVVRDQELVHAGGVGITAEPETGVVTACTMSVPERVTPIEGWQDG
jgi:hypothetical protein